MTLQEPVISRETTLWRLSAGTGTWADARVTLKPTDQAVVTLAFHALYGGDRAARVSMDDIRVTEGSCSLPGKTKLTRFYQHFRGSLIANVLC